MMLCLVYLVFPPSITCAVYSITSTICSITYNLRVLMLPPPLTVGARGMVTVKNEEIEVLSGAGSQDVQVPPFLQPQYLKLIEERGTAVLMLDHRLAKRKGE